MFILNSPNPETSYSPLKRKRIIFQDWFFQKPNKLSDYNVTWVMFTKWSHPTSKSAWSHQSRTFQGCYPIVAPATSFFIHGDNKQYVAGQWNSLTYTLVSFEKWLQIFHIYIQDTGGSNCKQISIWRVLAFGEDSLSYHLWRPLFFSGLQTYPPRATDSEQIGSLHVFWFRKPIQITSTETL